MIIEEYCIIKFMYVCFVFFLVWLLNLWWRCFGYIMLNIVFIFGKLLIIDDVIMNINLFISKFCFLIDGINLFVLIL